MSTIIDTLITDRTAEDAERVLYLKARHNDDTITPAESVEWGSNLKGAYTYVDLNRVGEACAYLYDLFTNLGYMVVGYTALKTDWAEEDKPTIADFEKYITTITAIKDVLPTVTEIPDGIAGLSFDGANNIEEMLIEVDTLIYNLSSIFIYSGMTYSGIVWLQIGG